MKRTWTPVCLSLAGLASLLLPSVSDAGHRRSSGCCGSSYSAPVYSGCNSCGGGYAYGGYASPVYSGGCSSCGTASYGYPSYSSMYAASYGGCNSCGGTAWSGSPAYYSAGAFQQTGTWSGGACSNCGPSTVYSGQTGVMQTGAYQTGVQGVQQAGYQGAAGTGTVILTVPENAQVFWGGQPVYGYGATRQFVTLPIQGNNGAQQFQVQWMGPNGQMISRNQSINAVAGQTVNYDFVNQNANAAAGTQGTQGSGQFGTEEAQPNSNDPNSPRRLPNPNQNNQNNKQGNQSGTQGNNPGSTTDIQGGTNRTNNNNTNPGASGTNNNTTNPGNSNNNDNNRNRKNRDDEKNPNQ